LKHAFIVAALALWFVFLFSNRVDSGPYDYDEADYMYAASLGPVTNAFDSRGPSLPQFVRLALTVGRDPARRVQLSEAVRGKDDSVFYRHSHGPALYYFLGALESAGLSERDIRFAMVVFPLASLLVIYFGSFFVLPVSVRFPGAVLAAALSIWNYAPVRSSEIAPHQFFALLYLAALLALAKFISTGRRTYWYLAVMVTAAAFCTLEVTVVLIATLIITAWLERKRIHFDGGLLWRSLLLFAATVLVLWPGAILRLSVIRSFMIYVYLLAFRSNPWGAVTLGDAWRGRLLDNPLDWLLLAVGIVIFFRFPGLSVRRLAYPFLMFGALMLVTVVRVASDSPRYVLPFIQAFDVFAAFVLVDFLQRYGPRVRAAVVGVLVVAAGLVAFLSVERHPTGAPNPRMPEVLASLRARNLGQASILVPQSDLPIIHYYFPRATLRGYRQRLPTAGDIAGRRFDAVLFPGYPLQLESPRDMQRRQPGAG